jgi:predicted dehydrogenase
VKEQELRVAVVGCGAVAELAHLPAAKMVDNCRITTLVDLNRGRAERLAEVFGVKTVATSASECLDCFDAAIIALPHVLHASTAIELLSQGKPVLIEKPMANTSDECEAIIAAATATSTVLGVGLMRRFLWAHRFTKELITKAILGSVESFDFREGAIYNWPVASDFFFRRDAAGGGVLIDTGAHTLDCLLDWLGDFAEVTYSDDAEGGVEANCLLELKMRSGATGTVELSRTRHLRNTAIIHCEHATVEVALAGNEINLTSRSQAYAVRGIAGNLNRPNENQNYLRTICEQLQDWIDAINQNRNPLVAGESAARSIQLIETCYKVRQPLVLPWTQVA